MPTLNHHHPADVANPIVPAIKPNGWCSRPAASPVFSWRRPKRAPTPGWAAALLSGLLSLTSMADLRAVEQTQICRFCQSGRESEAVGIDLPGNGFRYAPDRDVDVRHLKLDVTPDFGKRTVSGTVTMTIAAIAKPVSSVHLDGVDLTIHAVRATPIGIGDYTTTRTDLTISFAAPLPPEVPVVLEIEFSAQPTRGFYFRTPEMGYPAGDTHVWTQGEAHEARYWFPCFDYPNERSSTEVICHVPAEMTVLSNGKLMSETVDKESGLKAVRWLQEKPHVNYLICLVAGHFAKLTGQHRDVPLGFFSQPSLAKQAPNSFRDTAQIMAFLEEEIGVPFPWDKYYQVTIRDFVAGGMENTSLTTLTHRTIFSEDTENIRESWRLDAHEMAHQWFGDYVTCKDWSHLWLNEGFATYYAHLYEGHKLGRDALLYGLYQDAKQSIFPQKQDTTPIVFNAYQNAQQQFDYRAYPKGSWVLHMLRSQLGADLYRRCIQAYLEKHALSSVITDDLRQVFEQLSGQTLDRFFDQWVYHAGYPELRVKYQWLAETKVAKVTVTQTQTTNEHVLLFDFPTTLRFVMEDGSIVEREIRVQEVEEDFYVPLKAQPAIVRFDPELTVLADVNFDKPEEMLVAQLRQSGDVIGRLRAAEELGKRGSHRAIEELRRALQNDGFYGVRLSAARGLGRIDEDDAYQALRDSAAQDDARVRLEVVRQIVGKYRPEALESITQVAAKEANPAIVAAAIRGLAVFHDDTAGELLERYLNRESFGNELADAAIEAIQAQKSPQYAAELLNILQQRQEQFSNGDLRQAVRTLATIGAGTQTHDAIREFLLIKLNHPQVGLRVAAIEALGLLGDSKALSVLRVFVGDANERVSQAASEAIRKLEERKPLAPQELLKLREQVDELRRDNQSLRQALDDLKKRVDSPRE